MEQPQGFIVQGQEGKVCKLTKAMYGLKQAGWQWHMHLQDTLNMLRFQKNITGDVSIFIKMMMGGTTLPLCSSMLTVSQ